MESAADGEAGLAKAVAGKFDLVILDVMLPRKSGFDVCRELRQRGIDVAILMLTAKTPGGGSRGRVEARRRRLPDQAVRSGRTAGARGSPAAPGAARRIAFRCSRFKFGDVEVDFERAEVRKAGQPVNLASKELQLLRYLVDHRGRVVPREELLQNVWEYSGDVSSRTIDVHVAWLRQKLEDNPQTPKHIHTIRGMGYRFSL